MRIELKKMNAQRRAICEALRVKDAQAEYIASNAASLKTAEENPDVAVPFLICADDEPVGFAMLAVDLQNEDHDDRYWLWRFMIDGRMQGKGYGRAALAEVIRLLRDMDADVITLSTKESNHRALDLYHSFGFEENGEMNGDEAVLKLRLRSCI